MTSYVLAVFAVYRLSQLIAYDDGPLDCIADLRGAVYTKWKKTENRGLGSLFALLNCPYCLGVWFAFFVTIVTATIQARSFFEWLVFWWAVAGGQAFLQGLTDNPDQSGK